MYIHTHTALLYVHDYNMYRNSNERARDNGCQRQSTIAPMQFTEGIEAVRSSKMIRRRWMYREATGELNTFPAAA